MFCVLNIHPFVLFVSMVTRVLTQTNGNGHCTINNEVVVTNATARFAFLMSLRKNDPNSYSGGYSCSSLLSREPLQNYLAAEWAVERLNKANNGTGYIPEVKIGFYGMDDCRSAVYSSRNALSFLGAWVPSTSATCLNDDEELHIGLVGPSRSSTATRVASLLRDINVPIISMSATSADLSDSEKYPTFFRTVPSDDHQVNMIVQILEQMSWTYVAIVYSNDDYGLSASTKLSELAAKKSICVIKSFAFADSTSLSSDLQSLIMTAKGYSIAIPFIGNRDNAEQFLYTLNSVNKVEGRDIRHGFRVILSESTNTDVTIYKYKDFGIGTLAVGGSSIFLDDLHKDLTEKVKRVRDRLEKHGLIEQYYSGSQNPTDLISPNTLDTFVPLTVHAVFALAEALRAVHKDACGGSPGVCSALRLNVQKGEMLKAVKNVTVDYRLMEKGVPPEQFRENNYTVSFDSNGDIKLVNRNPLYAIYQYRGQKQYEQIGTYTDGKTILDVEKLQFLAPNGQPSSSLPTSVCSSNCADCLSNNVIPMAFLEGDVYIFGVFSIHEASGNSPFKCGGFRGVGNDAVAAEGFLYAVKDLRKITGINFGAIAIDDCYSPLRSTSILSDYFSGLIKSDLTVFTHHIPREKLAGVVACRSSGCTIPTAHFFMNMNVPVVSYSASSPDLDSKIDFPYFLRTVPSDVYQAQVMLDIVKTMNWEYVGLLYVKNNYGAKGIEEFKKLAMKEYSGICVAPELGINEYESPSDGADFRSIYEALINQKVPVVIFFGIDVRFRSFLQFLEKEKFYGNFIFIGSEDWGVNRGIYNSGPKSARGSLTLKVQDVQLESYSQFKQHLASKSPSVNDSNIWFSEFWQNEFNCSLKGGFINTFPKDCEPDLKLSQEQLDIRAGEQRVTQVMNAVYALGNGLAEARQKLCEDEFPCDYIRKRPGEVVNFIKMQKRQQGNLKFNIFDSDGNGALGYDVYNIQQQTPDGNPYVKIGTFSSKDNVNWNPTVFQKENLKFYSQPGAIKKEIISKCSETLCQHCPLLTKPEPGQVKENSSSMPEYRQSDILLISLIVVLILAVLVAIAVIFLCITKKYQVLKKTMQASKEEIYDEPDRIIYQPYIDTHGIRFANALNPYPLIKRINNGESSTSDVNGGLSNPAFVNDVDSVSQVGAVGNRKRSVQSDFQNQNRNDPVSLISSGQFVSPYSSRPLPVSPIGSDLVNRNMPSNHAYPEDGSENRRTSYPASSLADGKTDQNTFRGPPDTQSLASGPVCFVSSSSLRGRENNGSHIPEGIVYYMQGPNGQLSPHISLPAERGATTTERQHPLQQQTSVHSQNSAASSTVNPAYGPYSTAALQRLQMLQQHPQQHQISNGNTASLIYGNTSLVNDAPTNSNNKQSFLIARPVKLTGNRSFTDGDVEYSPIHYASPSRDSPNSVPNMTAVPQLSQPAQQQHVRANSFMSNMIQNGQEDSLSNEDNFHHDLGQSFREQDEPQMYQDSSPELSRHSMMSSSIPDVVGQSSPAHDLQRQDSLVSINLASSKESLDDLNTTVKTPGTKTNNKTILSALSALTGNVSKV